tara:strand:- start:776 stop:2248 length:1473 start_codon:yes stop_codon:yes gene_type:complete
MAAITLEQIDQNINSLPEEIQVVAEAAFDKLSQPELDAVMASFDLTLSEAPVVNQQEEVMPEPMMEEAAPVEEPMPEAPMPEAPMPEAPMPEPSPMQDQMQRLNLGGDVSGIIDVEGASETGVADDVPMEAREGDVFVNAEGLKKVGYGDFKRILKDNAKSLKERTGIEVKIQDIFQPSQQVKGGDSPVNVAASNNEARITKELAEEIGLDFLEKINKSGEPETEKKIAQEGQEQQQPQQAPIRANMGVTGVKKKVDLDSIKEAVLDVTTIIPGNRDLLMFTAQAESAMGQHKGMAKRKKVKTKYGTGTVGHGGVFQVTDQFLKEVQSIRTPNPNKNLPANRINLRKRIIDAKEVYKQAYGVDINSIKPSDLSEVRNSAFLARIKYFMSPSATVPDNQNSERYHSEWKKRYNVQKKNQSYAEWEKNNRNFILPIFDEDKQNAPFSSEGKLDSTPIKGSEKWIADREEEEGGGETITYYFDGSPDTQPPAN